MKGGSIKNYYCIKLNFQAKQNSSVELKILNSHFIKKNKNKCKIIFQNKIYDLYEYLEDINTHYNYKDTIQFKLFFIHNIIDMSMMFYNCSTLISVSNNNKINIFTEKIESNQLHIKKSSKLIEMKLVNLSHIFNGCISLISLPDISNWNIVNVKDLNSMFYNCNSLISLPDI